MIHRRTALTAAAAATTLAGLAPAAWAQGKKDSLVLAMTLEPPGLDPTAGAASAIAEVVQYNVLETLTKIRADSTIAPLLATSWTVTPDNKTWAFTLRPGVKFHNGEPFNAATVKFAFERAAAADSTNKDKAVFANIVNIRATDDLTVVVTLKNTNPDFLFQIGQATAVIVEPRSVASNNTQPVGTGPFKLESWQKGTAITLVKWDGYREAAAIKLRRATFRFINDNAAQVAALLAGDIDGMPRFGAVQAIAQLRADKRFVVEVGSTAGKGILAINNKKKPLDDVRVRRAISHAIDRKAFIDGVLEGLAKPIGSHAAPTDLGYVDLTGLYPHDPDKARALLKEAGITGPLNLTLTLPPPSYARKGGEVVAAQLAKVGITAKIENVEWAQWLSGAFKGNFDLTIINHVEPLDYVQYANPEYYWGYNSAAFNALVKKRAEAGRGKAQVALYADIQRQIANDAVNAFIFNPSQVSVARKGLRGLWANSPVAANDLSQVSWQ